MRLLAFLLAGTVAVAQQPSTPVALLVTGQVVAAANGAPLRRARVDVAVGNQRFGAVLTDDRGAFSVEVFGGGPFVVTVGKGGYAFARATLPREQLATPLTVRLSRGATVSGTVNDQNGVPAVGALVSAARQEEAPGLPQFFATNADDRGEFRLSGLPAGRYEITAGVGGTMLFGDLMTSGTLVAATLPRPVSNVTVVSKDGRATVVATSFPTEPRLVTVGEGDDAGGVGLSLRVNEQTVRSEMERARGLPPLPRGRAGEIVGRVTTESGRPLAEASVSAQGESGNLFAVRTLTDGTFAIRGLPAGSYAIQIQKPGYITAADSNRTIYVATDTVVRGIDFVARTGATISGTVLDEHGEPLQAASIEVLHVRDMGGSLQAAPVATSRSTDDRGRYRVYGLEPGRYLVATTIDATRTDADGRSRIGYAPVYYPGTPLIDVAAPIEVEHDITAANLIFTPSRAARVRGVALEAEGPLVAGTARLVTARRSRAIARDMPVATVGGDGAFFFSNVPPGEYAIQVRGDGPGRTGLYGVEYVSVGDADPAPVSVRTSRGATLEGRFVIEGQPGPSTCVTTQAPGVVVSSACNERQPAAAFTVTPLATDPDRRRPETGSGLVVSSEGTFYVTGLFGETAFVLRRRPSDAWYIKSVMIGGIDVTDSSYDFGLGGRTVEGAQVVIADDSATISGRVMDRDQPAAAFAVIVFPTLRDQWVPHARRLRFALPSQDGTFRVAGLPAGDYHVVAVDRIDGTVEGGEWQSADVLGRLVGSADRISLRERDTHATTLRLVRR